MAAHGGKMASSFTIHALPVVLDGQEATAISKSTRSPWLQNRAVRCHLGSALSLLRIPGQACSFLWSSFSTSRPGRDDPESFIAGFCCGTHRLMV